MSGEEFRTYSRDEFLGEFFPDPGDRIEITAGMERLRAEQRAFRLAEMRRRLGAASRQYVEKHHSLESVGAIFDAIVRHVWNDEALPSFIRKLPASA